MKKLFMILHLVLVLCFAYGDVAQVDIAAETEAVRDAHSGFCNASDEKKVDAMMPFFAEDVVVIFSSEPQNKTWLREYFTDQFSRGNSWKASRTPKVEVSASGDLAYLIGRVEYSRMVEDETRTNTFTSLLVWKKQADGSWKIVAF
ncbi:YybH family protein [Acidobacteriota bacterium]